MGKASLRRVPADHSSTPYDNRISHIDWWSVTTQALLLLITGTATWKLGAKIADVGGAVSGISIVAGPLFTMAVFLFQLRTTPDNDKRLDEDDFALVNECTASTFWAILWGMTLATYLIVCDAGKWIGYDSRGLTLAGIAVAGTVHFLLVIGICLKRLRRAYERIVVRCP